VLKAGEGPEPSALYAALKTPVALVVAWCNDWLRGLQAKVEGN
jgi:hypothetical protein